MRLLRRLLTPIPAWLRRDIVLAVVLMNVLPRFLHGFISQAGRICTHVSDQAHFAFIAKRQPLIELLGHTHGALRGETQFAYGFLLQGAGRERRRRIPPAGCFLHLGDRITYGLEISDDVLRLLCSSDVGFLPTDRAQARLKRRRVSRRHGSINRPVFLRLKCLNFLLTFANNTQSDGLDASGTQAPLHLLPQERADLIAHQAIE